MKKIIGVIWNYLKSAFSEGFVESVKGMLTGGSVGALIERWEGFIIGVLTGALLGAFIGSSLGKFFDLLLENIHLMFNVRKIYFNLELDDVSQDIAEELNPNYLLVRYGIDRVVLVNAKSKQDRLATRLRNKEIKICKTYNKDKKKLTIKCAIKRHVIYGIQFKLYFTGVPFSTIQPILNKVSYIKEITSGGGNQNKTYILIHEKTLVSDIKKDRKYSIAEVKSIEGIPNNYIYPK